jgi:hypothetical protein
VVKNLNTLSSRCPSAADLQAIDRDLRLVWRSDPTAGTVGCTKADGSRDLTVMQARVYRALYTMRHLSFSEPAAMDSRFRVPLVHARGAWAGFPRGRREQHCCSPDKLINIRAVVSPGPSGGQQGFMLAITSASQMPSGPFGCSHHSCSCSCMRRVMRTASRIRADRGDQTMEEMVRVEAPRTPSRHGCADMMETGLVPADLPREPAPAGETKICRTRDLTEGARRQQDP